MLQLIGLIVAAYTIPRLVKMTTVAANSNIIVQIVSIVALIATVALAWMLLTTGTSAPTYPRF